MKIAVASTEGKIIDLHFGDADQFLIFKIRNGEGIFQEIRKKTKFLLTIIKNVGLHQ
ncbi:hypothetical protein [Methanobacterium sp. SMA-27]|uniref:NifB/NifX family molybdenum-iron cluster-binding protein n=1 Tax=Methanobacterium sp. SMA-27 TaxID=1495336 RepID=UPI000A79E796|nr:hypothetical protein [Methanobacterium sp. SMA-27]